jgi:uncharacterized membrane protein
MKTIPIDHSKPSQRREARTIEAVDGKVLTERERIAAIDVLRGLVIVIMALDHTREFTHASGYAYNVLSPVQSTPLLYATRWITHLCAPTFVFLAGAGIRLQAINGRTGWSLAQRLLTRGLWLVVLELTVIGFAWSFSIPFLEFLQVIWAIGWSMILLVGLIELPAWISIAVGAVIIVASSALLAIPPKAFGEWAPLWGVIFRGGTFLPGADHPVAFAAYPILPWFGVMALGYGMGGVFTSPRRGQWLAFIGLAMLAAFLILRVPNLFGDARPWTLQHTAFWTLGAVLDANKNPPTLDFVLVTLGLVLAVVPMLERLPTPVADFFRVYGSVPFIAYIAHILVMHTYAIIARVIAGGTLAPMSNTMAAFMVDSQRFGAFSLPIGWVYVVWIAVVLTIYPLCRWWSSLKQRRRDWWLAYL